nr:NAD-dependent epimerase/dehydratase family protein [Bacteroidota bacterium]
MQNVLISGGTGLIGKRLTQLLLERGYGVTVLTRRPKQSLRACLTYSMWNPEQRELNNDDITKADFVINLAGAGVSDNRWNEKYKRIILGSRIQSTRLLVDKLNALDHDVGCFISASGIGYYGLDNEGILHEDAPAGRDFMASVCREWEIEAKRLNDNIRLFIPRIGIVLSTAGGALAEIIKPVRFFVGASLG